MRASAFLVVVVWLWGAVAHAAADPQVVTAALLQVDLWLDMGEHGKAVALSRRGVVQHPEDARWHLARLRSLYAAGMDAWTDTEYAELVHPPAAKAEAWAVWQVTQGNRLAPADEIGGVVVGRLRASLAADRGEVTTLPSFLSHDLEALGHLVRAGIVRQDWEAVAQQVAGWPSGEGPDVQLSPLAPVLQSGHPRLKEVSTSIAARADARLSEARHPLVLLDLALLWLRVGDGDRLAQVGERVDAVFGEPDMTKLLAGFDAGPEGWRVWEVPRRLRMSPQDLDALGQDLAKRGVRQIPWARDEERWRIAGAMAAAYEDAGKSVEADHVRLAHARNGCAWTRLPEVLVAQGRGREGRKLAEELLFRCIGGVDLVPSRDPASLDVDAEANELAGAWFRFGIVADLGHSFTDAALAYTIAARLQADPDRVKLAAARTRAAGLAHDRTGLPPIEVIRSTIKHAAWLAPAQALNASRARRGLARTLALLEPSPARMADRAVPDGLCVPTLRARCGLERAVAAEAYRRAGVPTPAGLTKFVDPGAVRAAPAWLDRQQALWFQRAGALQRASRVTDGTDRLADVVREPASIRRDHPMPEWSLQGVRSTDLRGPVLVLAFWGSWCRKCQVQLALVDVMAAQWKAEGLDVLPIAIGLDSDLDAYRRAAERVPLATLLHAHDPGLRGMLALEKVPTWVIVDGAGVVREVREGYGGTDLEWLDAAVRGAVMPSSEHEGG